MIPIIMDDSKKLTELVNDKSNGLGRLPEVLDCHVIEERNGIYELSFKIPINAKHYDKLHNGGIIKAKVGENVQIQLFRIFQMTKPLNGLVRINAQHLSYDLGQYAVRPFEEITGVTTAFLQIKNNLIGDDPNAWSFSSTSANDKSTFELKEPIQCRALLGGVKGSILDRFGGEFEFDNLKVKHHLHRGQDRGVILRYGKNLTALEQKENADGVYTHVLPWAKKDEKSQPVYAAPVEIFYSERKRIKVKDFSDKFKESEEITAKRLEELARSFGATAITEDKINTKVSFLNISETTEFENVKDMERVNLCDTVSVEFKDLGVITKAKVTKTDYDVLKEKYRSIELGESTTSSLAGTISEIKEKTKEEIKESRTTLKNELENITSKITGDAGGHIVFGFNANGEPEELFILDTDNKSTAVNVIRLNKNGIGFGNNGINGAFNSAWNINGDFIANYIRSGELNGDLLKAGVIADKSGQNYWNLETGEMHTAFNDELGNYINIKDGDVILGRKPKEDEPPQNLTKVVISGGHQNGTFPGIYFYDGAGVDPVASFTKDRLYVLATTILKRIDIGNFAIYPRDNGNLTMRKVR